MPPGGAKDDLKHDLVELYALYRELDPHDPYWRWPEGLLPIAHLGCAMYGCLDALKPKTPVIWFEPNPHEAGTPWDSSFIPLANTFEDWLNAWLDGRDLIREYAARAEAAEKDG